MPYATEDERKVSLSLGYTMTEDNHTGSRFIKDKRHVWCIRPGWQTANLINGYFTSHAQYTDLTDALKRDL